MGTKKGHNGKKDDKTVKIFHTKLIRQMYTIKEDKMNLNVTFIHEVSFKGEITLIIIIKNLINRFS